MKKIIWIFFGVMFFVSTEVKSQATNLFPPSVALNVVIPILTQPGQLCTDKLPEINVGNLSNTGAFSRIRTFYVTGGVKLHQTSVRNSGSIGVVLLNESEGNYIQKPRGSFLYNWQINLNSDYTFGTGIGVGFLGYTMASSDVSAGGSAFAPDASLGVWLESEKIKLGVSGQQLFNRNIRPIEYSFKYPRLYNVYSSYAFRLSETIELNPFLILSLKPEELNSDYDSGILLNISRFLLIGPCLRHQRTISFLISFSEIKITENDLLKFHFAYNYPTKNSLYKQPSSFELSLSFSRKKIVPDELSSQ